MAGDRRRLRGAEGRLLKGYAPLVVLVAALVVMVAVVPSKVPAELAAAGRGEATEVSVGPAGDRLERDRHGLPRPARAGARPRLLAPVLRVRGRQRRRRPPGASPPTRSGSATASRPTPTCSLLLGQLGGVPLDESNEEMYRRWPGAGRVGQRQLPALRPQDRAGPLRRARARSSPSSPGAGRTPPPTTASRWPTRSAPSPTSPGSPSPTPTPWPATRSSAIGAPYMSREWFEAHRPYAWSIVPDCTITAEASAIYANGRLFGRDADHAGGDLADEERTLAVIAPNNLEYQQCVDTFEEQIGAAGNEVALRLDYTLDPAQLKTQAASLMAKLKDEGTTSVSCACDPVMQMYLGQEATGHRVLPRVADRRRGLHRLGPRRPDHLEERPRPVGAGLRRQPVGRAAAARAQRRPRRLPQRARRRAVAARRQELFHQLLRPGARHPDGRART